MFFNEMEKMLKESSSDGLKHLLSYYGMELKLMRQTKNDAYSRVHGRSSGGETHQVKKFVGVLQGDDFFESGNTLFPSFQAGFLYTEDTDVTVGDTIIIISDDNRDRKYKIIAKETIGMTTTVFKKWKLSSIAS